MRSFARLALAALILVLAVGGTAWLIRSKPQPQPVQPVEPKWPVEVRVAEPGTFRPSVVLYGTTESAHSARVSAGLAAEVLTVPVGEGDVVSASQLLVTLDGRDVALRLRQREAELEELQAELALETERQRADRRALTRDQELLALAREAVTRAKELAAKNLGSRSQLDTARQERARQHLAIESRESALRSAAARVARLGARVAKASAVRDQASLEVERASVAAPFDARIIEVHVAPGDRVRVGDPLISLFDYRRIEVRAQIPTRWLARLRAALAAEDRLVITSVVDGTHLSGTLHRLGAQAHRGRGGMDGLFRLQSPPAWLGLGRTVQLTLALDGVENAVAIPLESLYGSDRIYTVVDQRMRAVRVSRLGERRAADGTTEALVRSPDLAPGDKIIATHLPNAVEGLLVAPRE